MDICTAKNSCTRRHSPGRLVLTSFLSHTFSLFLIHSPRIKMSITKDRKSNDRWTIDVDERTRLVLVY